MTDEWWSDKILFYWIVSYYKNFIFICSVNKTFLMLDFLYTEF